MERLLEIRSTRRARVSRELEMVQRRVWLSRQSRLDDILFRVHNAYNIT